MKTQQEFIHEILDLKMKNPDMEIHFCVDSEQTTDDRWTAHKIIEVKVNPWLVTKEFILNDEIEIEEYFIDLLFDPSLDDKEIERMAEIKYKNEVKQAICVYTDAE